MHVNTFFPKCAPSAWLSPTVVVVFPSPKGVGVMAVTTVLHALGGKAPTQLGDDAVDGREVCKRTGRQCAIELSQGTRWRQAARTLDLRALELAAQQRLEAAQRVAR